MLTWCQLKAKLPQIQGCYINVSVGVFNKFGHFERHHITDVLRHVCSNSTFYLDIYEPYNKSHNTQDLMLYCQQAILSSIRTFVQAHACGLVPYLCTCSGDGRNCKRAMAVQTADTTGSGGSQGAGEQCAQTLMINIEYK